MRNLVGVIVCAVAVFATNSVEAGFVYGFDGITNRNASHTQIGETQSFLDVSNNGGGLVTFALMNSQGGLASSITDIYFDDDNLFEPTITAIYNGPGTQFNQGASPNNLRGGGAVGFVTTPGLSLDSNSPIVANGVNPGEWVAIVLKLQTGKEFWDVTNALESADLRIGIQMKGFSKKSRESFVNIAPPPVVPEPTAAALAGLACFGLMFRRKKKHKPSVKKS
jgi:hypothetical protein